MSVYLKRGFSWALVSTGLRRYTKRGGAWKNITSGAENMYVKRGGAWKRWEGTVLAADPTQYRSYQLTYPGTLTAQASTAESVQDRLDGDVLQVTGYTLPGDGSIIVDLVGTQATATAMTNAVKAALEPWSTVTSLGPVT